MEELLSYLNQAVKENPEMPMGIDFMINELRRKIRSGLLSLHKAGAHIEYIVRQVGTDWPVVYPGYLLEYSGDRYEYLILALIAEAVAQAKGLPLGQRVLLAAMTSSGFQAVGETGLAEAALARAEDMFKAIPEDDPYRDIYNLGIMDVQMKIYGVLNQHAEVDQLLEQQLEQIKSLVLYHEDGLRERLILQEIASSRALAHYEGKRFKEALEAYPQCVSTLQRMMEEVNSQQDQDSKNCLRSIQHTLSGDLANWAAVLMDLAKYVEIFDIMTSDLPEEQRIQMVQEAGLNPLEVLRYLDEAMPALGRLFPDHISPYVLFNRARQLLEQALQLAEAAEGWEFAGVQAHRLVSLLVELDRPIDAEHMAEVAIRYSARVGDHTRIWTAEAFLASRALTRGDGPGALAHLRMCARERIREDIGLGHHAQTSYAILSLANAAFEATKVGGDPTEAVMIAESLKAATTAASLTHGMPIQPMGQTSEVSAQLLQELLQKREALRLSTIWKPEDRSLAEELRVLQLKIDEERKALSLRDPRFARWVDATDIDISDSKSLLRRLQQLGSKTTLVGMLPVGNKVWTYMVWSEGCIISQQPLPSLSEERVAVVPSLAFSKWWDKSYLTQLAATLLRSP